MSAPKKITLYICKKFHSSLIGRGGEEVRRLSSTYNCKIDIPAREVQQHSVDITTFGTDAQRLALLKEVDQLVGFAASRCTEPVKVLKLDIPSKDFGKLIGPKGETLRNFEEKVKGIDVILPEKGQDGPAMLAVPPQLMELAMNEIDKVMGYDVKAVGFAREAFAAPKKEKLAITGNISEVLFFPSHKPPGKNYTTFDRFLSYIHSAKKSLDVAVYTISDDRISGTLLDLMAEGVKVRMITDKSTADDLGSDTLSLSEKKLPIRVNTSEALMHHKFVVIDECLLINGSFNWTRSASQANQENVIVTTEPNLVKAYKDQFQQMWDDRSIVDDIGKFKIDAPSASGPAPRHQ